MRVSRPLWWFLAVMVLLVFMALVPLPLVLLVDEATGALLAGAVLVVWLVYVWRNHP